MSAESICYTLLADAKASMWAPAEVGIRRALYHAFRSKKYRVICRMRLSQYFYRRGGYVYRMLSVALYQKNMPFVDIHPAAVIGPGLRLAHPLGVVIGKDAIIGRDVRIQQNVTIGGNGGREVARDGETFTMPTIGNGCLIGPGACVLGPIVVGDDSKVGANVVLTESVQAGSIVFSTKHSVRVPETAPSGV